MAYDSTRGRTVLFAGDNGSVSLQDTWEWDGTNWTQRSSAISPTARWGHSLAYDNARVDEPTTIGGVSTTLPVDGTATTGVLDNANDTDGGSPDQDVFGFSARLGYVYSIAIRPQSSLAVAVDGPAVAVPSAAAAIGAAGSPLAQPSAAGSAATTLPTGTAVVLDARRSSAASGQVLAYHWVQLDGPPVVLSNPFSPLTTFIVPELGDSADRPYAFQLFVQSGNLESATVSALLDVVPLSGGTLVLSRGLNLVGLRVNPSAPGHAYTVGDLLQASGATWVAAPDVSSGRTRFRVFTTSTDPTTPIAQGSAGYLVLSPAYRAVSLTGPGWPAASASLSLVAGLNALSYPLGVPTGETAATLETRTGASIVLRLGAPDASGRRHFQPRVAGLSADYALQSGEGYLISVPSARAVTLPAGR